MAQDRIYIHTHLFAAVDVRPAATNLRRQAPARPRRRLLGELPAVHVHVLPPRVCRGLRLVRHWAPAATHPLAACERARKSTAVVNGAPCTARRCVRTVVFSCIRSSAPLSGRHGTGPAWHWAGMAQGRTALLGSAQIHRRPLGGRDGRDEAGSLVPPAQQSLPRSPMLLACVRTCSLRE